jgi:hypothetical protein
MYVPLAEAWAVGRILCSINLYTSVINSDCLSKYNFAFRKITVRARGAETHARCLCADLTGMVSNPKLPWRLGRRILTRFELWTCWKRGMSWSGAEALPCLSVCRTGSLGLSPGDWRPPDVTAGMECVVIHWPVIKGVAVTWFAWRCFTLQLNDSVMFTDTAEPMVPSPHFVIHSFFHWRFHYRTVVTICTTCFNQEYFCNVPTQCICYVHCMILTGHAIA